MLADYNNSGTEGSENQEYGLDELCYVFEDYSWDETEEHLEHLGKL